MEFCCPSLLSVFCHECNCLDSLYLIIKFIVLMNVIYFLCTVLVTSLVRCGHNLIITKDMLNKLYKLLLNSV